MNGEELYSLYVLYNNDLLNCGVESWEDLQPDEQSVWNAMADDIAERDTTV